MINIFAIDPGTTQSAYVLWDGETIIDKGKCDNKELLYGVSRPSIDVVVIEQIRSYGMPVGESVLDTVHWSGRFHQAAEFYGGNVVLMPRKNVKMHLCNTNRAKDSNIIQALRDKFAYGVRNYGKGTKAKPGFFHGFHSDIWQAFALGVTYYDLHVKQ